MKLTKLVIIKRIKDLSFSRLDDELLAIDSQAGYCYSLNETAGRVWDLIAFPLSIEEICSRLRREYAVDEETCLKKVTTLIEALIEAKLVEVCEAAGRRPE
jgi:hypothetical protein